MSKKQTPEKQPLRGKQKAFADAYISTLVGVTAAEMAKYKGDYNTLAVVAHENLRKTNIRAYINERLESFAPPPNEIIGRLAEQGTANISMFFKLGKNGLELNDKNIIKYGHLIEAVSETANGIRIKMYSAQHALEILGKHYALWIDKFEGEIKTMEKGYTTVSPDDWDEENEK